MHCFQDTCLAERQEQQELEQQQQLQQQHQELQQQEMQQQQQLLQQQLQLLQQQQQLLQQQQQLLQQQQDEQEFNMQAEMFLGDIMWGRCGKQPYWPCLVVRDEEGRFYKTKLCSNDVWRIWFYVQWLGDGRHSWVGLSYLVPFERAPNPQQTPYDMLKNYIQTHRKNKEQLKACKIPRRLAAKIDAAVEEALERQDRFE
ncbi:involucrin-like [Nilaparvata lugens]|uniref:involucrin-like n=1 Tax=Nilaparvata lugens TaxID=108931 RepID=UPI00193D7FA5|nr:involucrin-like [Nilaparvata lugens]